MRRVGDLKRASHFEAKFYRWKSFVLRQYLWTVRWENGYTTTTKPAVDFRVVLIELLSLSLAVEALGL